MCLRILQIGICLKYINIDIVLLIMVDWYHLTFMLVNCSVLRHFGEGTTGSASFLKRLTNMTSALDKEVDFQHLLEVHYQCRNDFGVLV